MENDNILDPFSFVTWTGRVVAVDFTVNRSLLWSAKN